MFASDLHIPPWELDRLTYEQVLQAVDSFKAQQAELEKLKQK